MNLKSIHFCRKSVLQRGQIKYLCGSNVGNIYPFTSDKHSSSLVLSVWLGIIPRPSVTFITNCSTLLQAPVEVRFRLIFGQKISAILTDINDSYPLLHRLFFMSIWPNSHMGKSLWHQLKKNLTLVFQPGDVDQSSVLSATHQSVKSVQTGSKAGLCADWWAQFS